MDNLLWNFIENFNDTFLREDFEKINKEKKPKYSSNEDYILKKVNQDDFRKKFSMKRKQRRINNRLKNLNKKKRESFKSSTKKSSKSTKKSSKSSKDAPKGNVGAQHHKLSASAKSKYVSAFKNTKKPKKGSKTSKSSKSSKEAPKGNVGAQHHKLSASAKSKYVSAFENTFDNEQIFIMLPKNLPLKNNSINILFPNNKKI